MRRTIPLAIRNYTTTNNKTLLFVLSLLLLSTACQTQSTPSATTSADNRASDEASLKAADEEWSKTAGTKDVDKTIAFYAADAVVLPPNSPVVTGKEPIRAMWKELLGGSGSINWKVTSVEAAKAGDIGYITGVYEITGPMPEKGKYLEVWKKQADGNWKCVRDMFSPDQAPAPSVAPVGPAAKPATSEKSK